MNQKFGMFIHWGIYSLGGLQEQEFARYDRTREEYERYAELFNPTAFDPDEIVLLAKNAGMKYICFTAKHHDGFCMWDTKYTDYKITNSPYGKDTLKMLAEACRRHGMLLSIYYSLPDWHHEYGYNPNSSHQWKAKEKIDTVIYREYVKNQITELLTGYGKIYTLFWDIPPGIEDPSVNELVRRLQPGILINDRGYDKGDFSTPEREYGAENAYGPYRRMTEACDSVSELSWGYREKDVLHSVRYLTCSIDQVMARGGSYLLNIGPKGDGSLDRKQAELVERVGRWYQRLEGCLEDAEPDLFDYGPGNPKCVVTKKKGKSYFHFFEGLTGNGVALRKIPGMPGKVRLLNTGEELTYNSEYLPYSFDAETGKKGPESLLISGIPVDELATEPIVIEIEW